MTTHDTSLASIYASSSAWSNRATANHSWCVDMDTQARSAPTRADSPAYGSLRTKVKRDSSLFIFDRDGEDSTNDGWRDLDATGRSHDSKRDSPCSETAGGAGLTLPGRWGAEARAGARVRTPARRDGGGAVERTRPRSRGTRPVWRRAEWQRGRARRNSPPLLAFLVGTSQLPCARARARAGAWHVRRRPDDARIDRWRQGAAGPHGWRPWNAPSAEYQAARAPGRDRPADALRERRRRGSAPARPHLLLPR